MKFSGQMCLKIIVKVTKNQGFTFSLEDTFFEKLRRGEVKLNPPALLPSVPGLKIGLHLIS